jgi:hypothetical protein
MKPKSHTITGYRPVMVFLQRAVCSCRWKSLPRTTIGRCHHDWLVHSGQKLW